MLEGGGEKMKPFVIEIKTLQAHVSLRGQRYDLPLPVPVRAKCWEVRSISSYQRIDSDHQPLSIMLVQDSFSDSSNQI